MVIGHKLSLKFDISTMKVIVLIFYTLTYIIIEIKGDVFSKRI